MHTYEKGNLAEAVLTAKLLQTGVQVLIPFGGGHRYDLVIEAGGGFQRVQVKMARVYKGAVVFNTCSKNKGYGRKAYHGDIDLFGVYCPELDECYMIPVADAGVSEMKLRIEPPKNGQSKGVNFKNDYRIAIPSPEAFAAII